MVGFQASRLTRGGLGKPNHSIPLPFGGGEPCQNDAFALAFTALPGLGQATAWYWRGTRQGMGGIKCLCLKFGHFSPLFTLSPCHYYVSKDKNLRFRVHPGLSVPYALCHHGHVHPISCYGSVFHSHRLRLAPDQPATPPPQNFVEWRDCSSGQNPPNTRVDGPARVKLCCRSSQ